MPKSITERKFITGNDHFKQIVGMIKPWLPKDWRERVYEEFPDMRTPEGQTTLNNIFYQRSACDMQVINFMIELSGANRRSLDRVKNEEV